MSTIVGPSAPRESATGSVSASVARKAVAYIGPVLSVLFLIGWVVMLAIHVVVPTDFTVLGIAVVGHTLGVSTSGIPS